MRALATTVALLLLAIMSSGCVQDEEPETDGDGPSDPVEGPTEGDAPPMEQLYLRHDGTRGWLSVQAGDPFDVPMATTEGQGPKRVSFVLEPELDADRSTMGFAVVHLQAGNIVTVNGPTFEVTLRIGEEASAPSVQRGSSTDHMLTVPESIPAGTPVEVEVCLCATSGTEAATLRTGPASFAIFPHEPPETDPDTPLSQDLQQGEVQVRQEGNRYVAERTDTAAFPDLDDPATAELRTVNGDARLSTSDSSRIEVVLQGRGDTESQARSRLATLEVQFVPGPADLILRVSSGTDDRDWSNRSASILAFTEDSRFTSARITTTNGDVEADGLDFGDLVTSTTNGDVFAGGIVSSWEGSTTNGDIHGSLEVSEGASIEADTTNGEVALGLERGDAAVDAEADTTNGAVDLDLDGTQPVGTQSARHGHVQTPGYDDADIQVLVTVSTTNGDASVYDD